MLLLFVVLIAFQYFYPGPLLLYITLVLIILEILAMIDLYFVKKTLQIDQQFDVMTIHQGDSMNIQYFAKSKLIYPILELKIDVINLQTGNTYSIEPPKISYDEGFVRLNYRFNEAGTIRFTLKEVRCKDFLHIAHFRKKMNLTFKLNVYPSPARITRNDVETQEVLNDGETSDQKGLDYAEIFGFHDYVYGEDIRHIHHKLSAKYDKWIMKEGSYTSKPIYIYHLKKIISSLN